MSANEQIGRLFADLAQTGSLAAALSGGVRLACLTGGCRAAALLCEPDAGGPPADWLRHDPDGLLGARPPGRRRPHTRRAAPAVRQVHIPLRCAGQELGRLMLLARPAVRDQQLGARLAGTCAALSVLLAAAENLALRPLSGVLGRAAFRTRLAAELSRCRRCQGRFAVLRLTVAPPAPGTDAKQSAPWRRTARWAEALAGRLRQSDVVGLTAPGELAVLLVGTGRAGARIAARRIEQLFRSPAGQSRGAPPPAAVLRVGGLKTFPEDGVEAADFCDARRWRSPALAAPGLMVGAG